MFAESHINDPEHVLVETADSVELSGILIAAAVPKLSVLISSGTGFPKEFYLDLAHHLARRGAAVLVYDFRGIGPSRDDSHLSRTDLPDWGRLDLDAAIKFLADRYPEIALVHLGHSAGGHMVGFASQHYRIRRHVFVACGSGTWYQHRPRRWPIELYFWWVLGPYCLKRWGYIKSLGGWSGHALPGPVFRTWRRWSHRRGYYRRELQTGLRPHYFSEVATPIQSWVFTDDGIATITTAREILEAYPNATTEIIVREPKDFGRTKIGHQGCFRPGFEPLWDEWWNWLSQHKV